MNEILAPAGNFESLIAAISNGADAIYLGMDKFGARAYASNFNKDNIKEAIDYAHLRNVKVYVTMNTIIFEEEIKPMQEMVDFLYQNNVDGLIIQDLAVFEYVVNTYPNMEAHCSTQMGIDDLEGTLFFKELGAKRVVLSREVSIENIKKIKKIAKIPLEVFVHGALCVSYSGNCLMSGLIGYRSGNRGRCVGSCRKAYDLIDATNNINYGKSYILSMKDLNTIDYLKELKTIDSLKIEGRMKEPAYVANVVSMYRKAVDNQEYKRFNLNKTFNRTFTKGYIFNEDKKDITNIDKPNNFGYLIGKVVDKNKIGYKIKLNSELNQNDIIRIDHNGTDVNLTVARMYDANQNYINKANDYCYINIKEELAVNDLVYKTKDYKFYAELANTYPKEYRRFDLNLSVIAYANNKLIINANCGDDNYYYEGPILAQAINQPTDEEAFVKQFDRLKETVYQLGEIDYQADSCFIPSKLINDARKEIVYNLNLQRLNIRKYQKNSNTEFKQIAYPINKPKLAAYCTTKAQYEACKEANVEIIYYDNNVVRRNLVKYEPKEGMVLVGGYGGIQYYKNQNEVTTDFSLNVVNSKAVHLLHSIGVNRVTLSHEINKNQIEQLIAAYYQENAGYPNLEMIVYGHAHLLYTRYCPLKKFNLCGKCKDSQYYIEDEYGKFPIISHEDCTTTIVNGKTLNLIDELEDIKNINVFRLQFTIENKEETLRVIKMYQEKLKDFSKTNYFNKDLDTRGHFNKEIM